MVTILYVIRHGETEGGEAKRYKGSIDVPLSEKGVRQMEKLSEYIFKSAHHSSSFIDSKHPDQYPSAPFLKDGEGGLLHAVYCSDLSRSKKSAELIAEPHSLEPSVVPSLRERNFGVWEGMNFDEIKEKYPAEFNAWAGNPLEFSPIGGESTLEVKRRVVNAVDEIVRNHNGKRIAIVSHGGVNRILLCHLLGIPLENIFRIEQDYSALNIIEFWDTYPVVKLINGTISG